MIRETRHIVLRSIRGNEGRWGSHGGSPINRRGLKVNAVSHRESRHEEKVMEVIRARFREARRSRVTGKMVIEIELMKGGPTNIYTEIGVIYRILEEG